MSQKIKVKFKKWDCYLRFDKYSYGGGIAIGLFDEEGPIATATVNIEGFQEPGMVLIKDYSENAGMLDALVKAGVVEDTGRRIQSGFVQIPICKLLISPN